MKTVESCFSGSIPDGTIIKDTGEEDNLFVIWNDTLYGIGPLCHDSQSINPGSKDSLARAFDDMTGDSDLTRYVILNNEEAREFVLKFFLIKDTHRATNKERNKQSRARKAPKTTRRV